MSENKDRKLTPREIAAEERKRMADLFENSIPAIAITGETELPILRFSLDYIICKMEVSALALLAGVGGIGKGILALQLCFAIAGISHIDQKTKIAKCAFGIWKKHKPHGDKVIYLTCEDSDKVIKNRMISIRYYYEDLYPGDKEKGLREFEEARKNIIVIPIGGGRIPKLGIREGNQQDLPSPGPLLPILARLIKQHGAKMLIVDPLAKLHLLSENSNEDMSELFQMIEEVIKPLGCGCLLIHHDGRGAQNRDMQSDSGSGRGASAIGYSVRVAQSIQAMTVAEAKKRGIIKDIEEDDDESEADQHAERLQWLYYKKSQKENNGPKTGDDFVWLKRNEHGVLLPETPPSPEKKKRASNGRNRSRGNNNPVNNDNRELMEVLRNAAKQS
jgi:regulatory protein RepA